MPKRPQQYGDAPIDDPRGVIEALVQITKQICADTGRDPAEGTMMLLTAASTIYRHFAADPHDPQPLHDALSNACDAASEWWKIKDAGDTLQ
jgi:hypothetical protein